MTDRDELKRAVCAEVDRLADRLWATARWIGEHPELGYQEHQAAERLAGLLAEAGLPVQRGLGQLDTALRAELGEGGPTVAILAEYDALPEVGHACGHNLIGTSAVGATMALATVRDQLGGRVVCLGTPAEESAVENSGGKAHLLAAGVFDDVDAAIMMHPGTNHAVFYEGSLAARGADFAFHGKSAHAAVAPHQGINALDAVIQTFNGVSALRQQVRQDVRIHGIITDGGRAPNVIPAYAACRFRVRARDAGYLEKVFDRVVRCAEAGALATGSRLKWREYMPPYENLVNNRTIGEAFRANLKALGLEVLAKRSRPDLGSTDFGNVSRRLPSTEARIAIAPPGTPGHSVAFAEAALSEQGRAGLLYAAKGLAMTAIDLLDEPALLDHARAELARSLDGAVPAPAPTG